MSEVPDFDQYVEYVISGPTLHPVALSNHALAEAVETIEAVASGYVHLSDLLRPVVADGELAMLFAEWTSEGGLVTIPGVIASTVLRAWVAKNVCVAYIIAPSPVIAQINTDRTVAVAFVRFSLVSGNGTPLGPRQPFTSGQVSALSTWINAHGITNTEFAALFDVTPAQLSAWLQNHPRWQFVKQLYERFI